jgi:hypothetical protein
MMTRSEKPSEPSGILVVMRPMAVRLMKPLKTSCRTPAYSPRSVSMKW